MRKYWNVALLGWQDSLVYRFNALVWVFYAVLPSATLMLVWLAAYETGGRERIGGFDLPGMMTYYLCVTALSVVITPHPEWDIAEQIRTGKITQFIVRPIGFYGYRAAQETSYQIVKSAMLLPPLALLMLLFRAYLRLPQVDAARLGCFLLASLLAYALLTQLKFLLGISAFWIAEPGGFLEIWNILSGVFGGRMLPLSVLPAWLVSLGQVMPFASLYSFPMRVLFEPLTTEQLCEGFARQLVWLALLSSLVRWTWQRGLRAYEAYGG